MRLRRLLHAAVMGLIWVGGVAAQGGPTYPSGLVRLIVPYAAGNTTDVLARILTERLSAGWGQSVIVDNRPGVAGSLGAAQVAKSNPDGLTLLLTGPATITINPHIYANIGYDPLQSFDFVSIVAWAPLVCVVPGRSDATNFAGLVAASKRRVLNFGTNGVGTISHLAMETMKTRFGLSAEAVPYRGANAAMADLIAGRIDVVCDAASVTMSQVQAGSVRAIGVTSRQRLSVLPDVPTLIEQGYAYTTGAWFGLLAPKGVPPAALARVHDDVRRILDDKDVRAKLDGLGFEILQLDPAASIARARGDYDEYGRIARSLRLKVD